MGERIGMVVFDMDGVLAHLDRAHRLRLLCEMTGRDAAYLEDAVWTSGFEADAESGAYPTGNAYLAEFNRRAGSRLTREQWVRARRESMTPDPRTLRIAEVLSRHCTTAMLTNNVSLLYESLPQILPEALRVFGERAHASCQFNARKPEPEVFQRLLARYHMSAAAAVFVDDTPEFVDGARRAGMHGIDYTDPAGLRARLAELGLPIGPG